MAFGMHETGAAPTNEDIKAERDELLVQLKKIQTAIDDAKLQADQVVDYTNELHDLKIKLAAAEKMTDEANETLASINEAIEESKSKLETVDAALGLEKLRALIGEATTALAELGTEATAKLNETEEAQRKLGEIKIQTTEEANTLLSIKEEIKAAEIERDNKITERTAAQKYYATTQTEFNALKHAHEELSFKHDALRADHEQLGKDHEQLKIENEANKKDAAAVRQSIEDAKLEVDKILADAKAEAERIVEAAKAGVEADRKKNEDEAGFLSHRRKLIRDKEKYLRIVVSDLEVIHHSKIPVNFGEELPE